MPACLVGALAWVAAAPGARGDGDRRLDHLVAGAHRLYALRGGEVITFDAHGNQIARCARFAADSPPARRQTSAPDADDVLHDARLPDDDSSLAAEEALEDEGIGARRRRAPPTEASVEARTLAARANADEVWIATSSGLFRSDDDGCQPAGLAGRDLIAVTAADGWIAAATDGLLWLAPAEPPLAFAVTAGLTARPRALALAADGVVLIGDDAGVLQIDAGGAAIRILDQPTIALAACGGRMVALAGDGVYAWSSGQAPARVADRLPARAIGCGGAPGARFIAAGAGTWLSDDGATWSELGATLGRSVNGAAAIGAATWLAIDDALVAADDDDRSLLGPVTSFAALAVPPPPTRARGRGEPWVPLPRVTLAFGGERTPVRAGWSVFALLTFPLGGSRRGHVQAQADVAAAISRRDAALAAEQVALSFRAPGDDLAAARARAVADEREALP